MKRYLHRFTFVYPLELFITFLILTSYTFWYERHLRSYGILAISLIGLIALIGGKYRSLKFSREDFFIFFCFASFSFYHLIRSILGVDPWSEFDRYSRAMLAVPFCLILVKLSNVSLYKLLKVIIACSIISFFMAFVYYFGKVMVITLGMNAIQLSFTCCIYTVLATFFVTTVTTRAEKIVWIVLFILSLFGIIMASRLSGFLFLAFLILLFTAHAIKRYRYKAWIGLAIIFLFLISCVSLTNTHIEDRVVDSARLVSHLVINYDEITDDYLAGLDTSITPRLLLWKHGLQLIGDDFWLGIGAEALHKSYASNLALEKFFGNVTPNLHNGFLQEFVVKGYIGLLLFLSIIVIPFGYFYDACRSASSSDYKAVSLMGMGVIFVFVLNNLTQVIFGHMNGVMLYCFTIMLLWATLYSLRYGVCAADKQSNVIG